MKYSYVMRFHTNNFRYVLHIRNLRGRKVITFLFLVLHNNARPPWCIPYRNRFQSWQLTRDNAMKKEHTSQEANVHVDSWRVTSTYSYSFLILCTWAVGFLNAFVTSSEEFIRDYSFFELWKTRFSVIIK